MWWSLFLIDHDTSEFDNGALSYQPVVSYESRQQCENGRLLYIDKGEFNLLLKRGWEVSTELVAIHYARDLAGSFGWCGTEVKVDMP